MSAQNNKEIMPVEVNVSAPALVEIANDVSEMRYQMEVMATAILKIETYVCEIARRKATK